MWLLNAETRKLHEFMTDKPCYVILSHTWGKEEVSFRDIHEVHDVHDEDIQTKAGYQKILKCCEQAIQAGFEWVWIDTCCINKDSSAELTEAINSMYSWYWEAEICYAFLVDVGGDDDSTTGNEGFINANWFNRGWTLQELLAPSVVEFYNHDWKFIGTKRGLVAEISRATGIQTSYLLNREVVGNATVGTRFSWASMRITTRPEDIAYCLLGLFAVNMPLLYGEGIRAFYRLQLEIIASSSDHTIFAWDPQPDDVFEMMGIFAPSPRQFRQAATIKSANLPRAVPIETMYSTYNITNHGLRISLPRVDGPCLGRHIGLLNCKRSGIYNPYIGIQLEGNPNVKRTFGNTRLVRTLNSKLVALSRKEASNNYPYSVHIHAESRLLSTSSNVSRSRIKVDLVRVESPYCVLRDMAVVEQDGCLRWILDEEKVADRTLVILGDKVFISFEIEGMTSAIIVGYREGKVMLSTMSRITGSTLEDHMECLRDIESKRALSTDKDSVAEAISPNTLVSVSARKTGTVGGVLWSLLVDIRHRHSGADNDFG